MRILLIEDEREYIDELLEEMTGKYVVDVAYSGCEGTYLSQVNDYDAILVDSSLPDMPGIDVCRETREAEVEAPIMYVSENQDLSHKLASLDSGADAYVTKPLNKEEVAAKLRALVRRNGCPSCCVKVCLGEVIVNIKTREVLVNGVRILLRRKEYDVLEYLVINLGRIVSKEELLEHIWEDGINIFSNTVEVHIKNLRDKLVQADLIKTIRGFGYVIYKDNS